MSDDVFEVDVERRCAFCGEQFGVDGERELVVVEYGEMVPMKRDPNFLRFHSKRQDEDGLLEIYHADCFIDRFRKTEWGMNSPMGCDLCGFNFQKARYAFRARLGRQDFETGLFDALDDPRNSTLLCPECIAEGFGEGDVEEGELLLGIGG